MPWNPDWPVGNISVRENRAKGDENMKYIQNTMGNDAVGTNAAGTRDHFWNVSSDLNGHHRFVKSPKFTVGGVAADAVVGTGMDGVLYMKETNGRTQGYFRNNSGGVNSGVYQYIPSFVIGTIAISGSTYQTLATIPASCYGEVFMFFETDRSICQNAIICSSATRVRAYSSRLKQNSGSESYFLEFDNSGSAGFSLRAKLGDSSSTYDGTWHFRLTYRAF